MRQIAKLPQLLLALLIMIAILAADGEFKFTGQRVTEKQIRIVRAADVIDHPGLCKPDVWNGPG